ncbi:MAG: polysaccharide deacetylase family protein [Actinomycetota bacterium]|nr:polysaccharide deacetylase family protein [Actinomycetota bacterium]
MRSEQRQELGRWAEALARSEAAELRAAGRAIKALCEENGQLARRLHELEVVRERSDDDETPPTAPRQSMRARRVRNKIRLPWRFAVVLLGALTIAAALVALVARAGTPDVDAVGPAQEATLGPAELASLTFSTSAASAERQTWSMDGKRVQPTREGGRLVLRPRRLADGHHTLVIRERGSLWGSGKRSFGFAVDTTPPKLRLDTPAVARRGEALTLRGRLEPDGRLRHGRADIELNESGAFVLRLTQAPRRIVLDARDRAGNASRWRVPVTVIPRRPSKPVRAVHVTAYAWADETLRRGIMELIRERRINAVELDLKDEAGEIGWNPPVPLARRMGSALDVYDLEKAVTELHERGVRVIGRLVCFRDPIHAASAWKAGRRDEVVQTPGGEPYAGYGGFTNFASPAVRKYNIDIAVEAAKLGIDEILYDYVRRPDGPPDSMTFPGLRGTPERSIAGFLAESRAALASYDVLVGASVFGVAATRPTEVAQDIPAMARQLDYVAPMLYPSHWGPGEYGVADPNGSPYEIVKLSSRDFVKQVRGTGARVVNWLQDFSYGRDYGPEEVRAQIRGSREAGVDEFILWDAAVSYTEAALEPTAPMPALGLSTASPPHAPGPVRLAAPTTSGQPRTKLEPNELGGIPVVMHHMVRADRVGDYDQTPAEFRTELELLWKQGYVPIGMGDLLAGRVDVGEGLTPIVMTFDDSTSYQLALDEGGEVEPSTAVGIMLDFAKRHPGFEPAGTFYVNREPFGDGERSAELLRWLVEHGFELGNHTHDHLPLHELSDAEVQRQIAKGAEVILAAVPGYRIRSFALPLGMIPRNPRLAVRGSANGRSYGPYGVALIGAEPSPSPFARAFRPEAIPRIRSSHGDWKGDADFAFSYWLRELDRHPETRFVSDGDSATITVAEGAAEKLKPRYRRLAHRRN